MYSLPIASLIAISVITLWIRSIINGYYSKSVSKDNAFLIWLFGGVQSLACLIMITFIFLISGGLKTVSPFTIVMGLLMGCINIINVYTNMKAVSKGPFSYTTVIINLSTIVTALSGLLFFDESISAIQLVGIVLMTVCIFLSTEKKDDEQAKKANTIWLMLTLIATVTSGATGVIQKAHQTSSFANEIPAILMICFGISVVFSIIMAFVQKDREEIKIKENTTKIFLMPIISGAFFAFPHSINIYLSGKMPAVIFFPLINFLPMVLTMVMGIILFKEKLTKKQWTGIAFGMASMILLSGLF